MLFVKVSCLFSLFSHGNKDSLFVQFFVGMKEKYPPSKLDRAPLKSKGKGQAGIQSSTLMLESASAG